MEENYIIMQDLKKKLKILTFDFQNTYILEKTILQTCMILSKFQKYSLNHLYFQLTTSYFILFFNFDTTNQRCKAHHGCLFFKIFFIYIKKKTMNCSNQPCLTIFYFLFIFIFSFLHNTFDIFFI